jgi:hypothetical protein
VRCGARRSVVELSCDQTILEHLEEDAARGYRYAIVVSPIDSAKLPAAAAAVEVLKEAVPSATPRVCLNGVAAVLLE